MPAAAHRIHRQIIELRIDDEATAAEIHQRISQAQDEIQRELEAGFDQIARMGKPIRIDRLSIDLGQLPAESIATELQTALRLALPQALEAAVAEQAGAPGRSTGDTDHFELLERLLNGRPPPWWADVRQRNLLDEALGSLIESQRSEHRLRQLLASESAAYRAAMQLTPRRGAALVEQLATGRGRDARTVIDRVLADTPQRQRRQLRQALWAAALQTAAASNSATRIDFWREVIARLAERNRLSLRAQLAQLGEQGARISIVEQLRAELPAEARSDPAEIRDQLGLLGKHVPALAALLKAISSALRQQPDAAGSVAPSVAALLRIAKARVPIAELQPELAKLLRQSRREGLISADQLNRELQRWQQSPDEFGGDNIAALRSELGANKNEPNAAEHPSAASGADGIPVINAGLVLLWPFLATFFERVGLISEKRFQDRAAQDQAVALLHYLASGDPDPPEYQLPLAKLLCGLPVGAQWQPERTIDAALRAESNGLLEATINRAGVFGSVSQAGFRTSFLLRDGMLRGEADGWLLSVERQTFDVLLDRLPWPTSWIKLPWMPAALQVEW